MIELARINIIVEMSLLSSHLVLPREVHFDVAVYVIAYVGQKYNSRLVYDLSCLEIDHGVLSQYEGGYICEYPRTLRIHFVHSDDQNTD